MSTPQSQCWAFRVDRRYLSDLDGELQNGRLRQGWGWDKRQDLRAMEVDAGAVEIDKCLARSKKVTAY
jgi:hypothetical protein